MRTMQELAREALLVQDACNLSGVVHSFSRAITELREILRKEGTEGTSAVNEHPICVLYANKIATLTNQDVDSMNMLFSRAYKWACEQ